MAAVDFAYGGRAGMLADMETPPALPPVVYYRMVQDGAGWRLDELRDNQGWTPIGVFPSKVAAETWVFGPLDYPTQAR